MSLVTGSGQKTFKVHCLTARSSDVKYLAQKAAQCPAHLTISYKDQSALSGHTSSQQDMTGSVFPDTVQHSLGAEQAT